MMSVTHLRRIAADELITARESVAKFHEAMLAGGSGLKIRCFGTKVGVRYVIRTRSCLAFAPRLLLLHIAIPDRSA